MEKLGKLFGSENRIKILRLFLINQESIFTKEEIAKRSRVSKNNVIKEINSLKKIDFLEEKKIRPDTNSKKTIVGLHLNKEFIYLEGLRSLLLGSEILRGEELLKKLKGVGRVKLVVTAGVFVDNENSPADLLVVGDNIKRKPLTNIVKAIESEIGREIKYGVFDTEDFKYRLNVYDKFVRQIMDFPHNKILDKLYE